MFALTNFLPTIKGCSNKLHCLCAVSLNILPGSCNIDIRKNTITLSKYVIESKECSDILLQNSYKPYLYYYTAVAFIAVD